MVSFRLRMMATSLFEAQTPNSLFSVIKETINDSGMHFNINLAECNNTEDPEMNS